MHEFQNIAYMDLQKTGSTWVVSVLYDLVAEPSSYRNIHGTVRQAPKKTKLYFISVREPLSSYISLFTFGCQKRGSAYRRFSNNGLEHFYEPTPAAFERWLAFVLEPENSAQVMKSYVKRSPSDLIGMYTYRMMHISIPSDVIPRVKTMRDRDEIEAFVRGEAYFDAYVRTENLADDLRDVLRAWQDRVKLKRPILATDDFAAQFERKNTSPKIEGLKRDSVSKELQQRTTDREWLYAKLFGYDINPKGLPCPLIAGL